MFLGCDDVTENVDALGKAEVVWGCDDASEKVDSLGKTEVFLRVKEF